MGSDVIPFFSTINNKAQAGNSHINDGGPLSAGLRKTDEQKKDGGPLYVYPVGASRSTYVWPP